MERVKEIVLLDASVVVKWFVREEYSEKALEIRRSYLARRINIACPQILPFEVLNALRYNPEFGEEQLNIASVALQKYQFRLYPILGEIAHLCVENALKFGISIYDASYLSLAEHLDSKCYTADERLYCR
ncbi:MAG: type II toxin-antitoxin system VapC family toxin [Nitrososphaerales archaeon]